MFLRPPPGVWWLVQLGDLATRGRARLDERGILFTFRVEACWYPGGLDFGSTVTASAMLKRGAVAYGGGLALLLVNGACGGTLPTSLPIYTTYISGDNRGYSGTIPTELGDLTGITGLNLYFNKVSTASDRPRPLSIALCFASCRPRPSTPRLMQCPHAACPALLHAASRS